MWWLLRSAPDFWGRSPGFESVISNNDPDELQDHCVLCNNVKLRVREKYLACKRKIMDRQEEKFGKRKEK